MIECIFCKKQYKNNLSGCFTIHLLDEHNVSLKEYIVQIEYNNVAPIGQKKNSNNSEMNPGIYQKKIGVGL